MKVYHALRRKGHKIPFRLVKRIVQECEICARFRPAVPRRPWGQPPFSKIPGHTVFADVIGPLPVGRGGIRYLHCIIDSATRVADAVPLKTTQSTGIIRALNRWLKQRGPISVLVSDNAAYYSSVDLADWCWSHDVRHVFTAPYHHQSNGLVERFNRSLEDRLRKLHLAHGGSWIDFVRRAVVALNTARHSTTLFVPEDLWKGNPKELDLAHQRSVQERQYRNAGRRVSPTAFFQGQPVLIRDELAPGTSEGKFTPKWRGPYILMDRVSDSYWKLRKMGGFRGKGRRPILIYHEDHLQPFDL